MLAFTEQVVAIIINNLSFIQIVLAQYIINKEEYQSYTKIVSHDATSISKNKFQYILLVLQASFQIVIIIRKNNLILKATL